MPFPRLGRYGFAQAEYALNAPLVSPLAGKFPYCDDFVHFITSIITGEHPQCAPHITVLHIPPTLSTAPFISEFDQYPSMITFDFVPFVIPYYLHNFEAMKVVTCRKRH